MASTDSLHGSHDHDRERPPGDERGPAHETRPPMPMTVSSPDDDDDDDDMDYIPDHSVDV